MNMNDFKETIKTKEDFCEFLDMYIDDYENKPEKWDNDALLLFLKAMARYMASLKNVYDFRDIKENANRPSWRQFADILTGAKFYE